MKRALAVLALLVIPTFGFAQNVTITVEAFEKVLDNLKIEFEKKGDEAKVIEYDLKDTPYFAAYNARNKYINFFLKAKAGNINLEKVNKWNQEALWSRAYLVGQAVVVESTVSTVDVSPAVVRNSYRLFDAEAKKFLPLLNADQ